MPEVTQTIARTPAEFLRAFDDGRGYPPADRPAMAAALLVSPLGLRVSSESASDNLYMDASQRIDPERAMAQHAALAQKLAALGVPVVLFSGREGLDDAVFPNNVYATARRRFIVGSMRHEVRRREAQREDVRAFFRDVLGYEVVDLSTRRCVAELTGPLVIDRVRGLGFCGMTGRVDDAGLEAMHAAFGLRLTFRFELQPSEYHTNLVLAVLAGRACVIHTASFADAEAAQAIARAFPERALELSDEEKGAFAGNCIAATAEDVLFSATSLKALRPPSRAELERWGFRIHGVEVDEIEKAGGSLRCLIAEVF